MFFCSMPATLEPPEDLAVQPSVPVSTTNADVDQSLQDTATMSFTRDQLESMNVKTLAEHLRRRDLKTTGSKGAQINRLVAYFNGDR